MKKLILLLAAALLTFGCATTMPEKTYVSEGIRAFSFVDGKVIESSGPMFTVRPVLAVDTAGMGAYDRIAAKVVEKAFLLENMKTKINGEDAALLEKRGDILLFSSKNGRFSAGEDVKIYVPKKTLAVTSFKAYKNSTEDIGDVWMEGLTASMVNTGQFNVVERSRLAEILSELKLELVGLTDSSMASKVGKMLNADMILTGSLNDMGGYWDVNIRLVNTATSVIMSAITDRITYEELKPGSMRTTDNIHATFEEDAKGFNLGYKATKKNNRNVYIDSVGANGTAKSIRVDFEFENMNGRVGINNGVDRDLSLYKGVEFYAKADKKFNIKFMLADENRDDPQAIDYFLKDVVLDTSWQKFRVPFDALHYMKHIEDKTPNLKKGDTILSLDLVREVQFIFTPRTTPKINGKPVKKGSFWIDEVNFY